MRLYCHTVSNGIEYEAQSDSYHLYPEQRSTVVDCVVSFT